MTSYNVLVCDRCEDETKRGGSQTGWFTVETTPLNDTPGKPGMFDLCGSCHAGFLKYVFKNIGLAE